MDKKNSGTVQRKGDKKLKDIELFLFDLDGTLINSAQDIAEAVNFTLKELGKNPLPNDEIIKHVGYGARNLMKDILKTLDNNIIDRATNIFRDYYLKHSCEYTKPYPYIVELLNILKERNKKIGVITNKFEAVSKEILDKLNLSKYTDILIGADTTEERKPSPKPVLYALETLNVRPENSIIIGDSEVDIQAGKNAGINTALVLYGYGKTELAKQLNPDYIFSNVNEIINHFLDK